MKRWEYEDMMKKHKKLAKKPKNEAQRDEEIRECVFGGFTHLSRPMLWHMYVQAGTGKGA
jgi:hypothetical protein